MIELIIENEIKKATSDSPITSTRLIQIVFNETRQVLTARKIRRIVDSFRREQHLPILATRSGKQGYFFCQSKAEFEDYEREVRNHALKELTTIKEIKSAFFGTSQKELVFI